MGPVPIYSLFDCNRPLEKSIEILIEKRKSKQLKFKGDISHEILEKLRGGVLASPLVTQTCKKMLGK